MMTEEQQRVADWCAEELARYENHNPATDLDQILIKTMRIALAALTQPASPALKLPDVKPVDLADENWDDESLAENIGFNRCLLEVKRLNAPHTAPIELICASGRTMPTHEFSLMVNELRDVDNTQSRRAKIIGVLHAFNIRPRKPE